MLKVISICHIMTNNAELLTQKCYKNESEITQNCLAQYYNYKTRKKKKN